MRILLIVVGLLAWTPDVWAFHEVASFERSANSGGGGNSYFTGSKRFKGYDCNICHVGAEHQISIELEGPLRSGTYQAGLIYPIKVKLIGEHRGLESAFNPNTFTLDVTGRDGLPVGSLRGASGSIVELLDAGGIAVAEGFGNGENEWELSWWAPEDAVPATLHIAMLDGDGASDPIERFIDPLNDDVATLKLELCPADTECEPEEPAPGETSRVGCSVGGTSFASYWALLIAMLLLSTRLRNRSR